MSVLRQERETSDKFRAEQTGFSGLDHGDGYYFDDTKIF